MSKNIQVVITVDRDQILRQIGRLCALRADITDEELSEVLGVNFTNFFASGIVDQYFVDAFNADEIEDFEPLMEHDEEDEE